MQPYIR